MQLSGRPLLDNPVDQALFVPRKDELAALAHAAVLGLNAVVSGAAGCGRTSLLRAHLYAGRTPALTASGAGAQTGAQLLERIGTLEDLAQREPTLIVVDDVPAGAGHDLFGRLRDQLWGLGHRWIVTTRSADRGGLLLPPADAFFEQHVEIPPMTPPEATDLLQRRVGAQAWIPRLAEAGGLPRDLLDAARDLIEHPADVEELLSARAQRDAAIHALGRPATMLAAELAALGAAAASDEALLSRLGWTRARAVQVLGQLEGAGLVRSDDVRNGQGRPRKVFRLA